MISTRGRYALRVLIDLAEHRNGQFIPMKEVAERQEISLKYIERIMPLLTKEKFVEGQHGKGGGYKLCREPENYTVGEIPRAAACRTLPMWERYYKMTNDYFNGITLADLMNTEIGQDYVI